MKYVVILILLVAVAAWYVRRRRSETATAEADEPALTSTSEFHAVSLRFPKNACAAAKALAGQRFLAAAAPRLPLPECDAPQCGCSFKHHEDRRSGEDRRNPFGPGAIMRATGRHKAERRGGPGRRATDRDESAL